MTRKSFIITAAITAAIAVAIPFACSEKLQCEHYDIPVKGLTAPVKLAFLSDVHDTRFGNDMSQLTEAVDKFSPDAVVFGGDLFNRRWGEENTITLIRKLAARYPCFYALGNHEFYDNEQDIIRRETAALGVNVLNGSFCDLQTAGGTVRFIGNERWRGVSSDITGLISSDAVNILIYHYPEDFSKYKGLGLSLILAGHAHGGVMRIPPLMNGLYSPGEGFFPKYTGGIYTDGEDRMIVSRGLQRCTRDLFIPRVFNRPELSLITLRESCAV